jgi:hypothetical protein
MASYVDAGVGSGQVREGARSKAASVTLLRRKQLNAGN